MERFDIGYGYGMGEQSQFACLADSVRMKRIIRGELFNTLFRTITDSLGNNWRVNRLRIVAGKSPGRQDSINSNHRIIEYKLNKLGQKHGGSKVVVVAVHYMDVRAKYEKTGSSL